MMGKTGGSENKRVLSLDWRGWDGLGMSFEYLTSGVREGERNHRSPRSTFRRSGPAAARQQLWLPCGCCAGPVAVGKTRSRNANEIEIPNQTSGKEISNSSAWLYRARSAPCCYNCLLLKGSQSRYVEYCRLQFFVPLLLRETISRVNRKQIKISPSSCSGGRGIHSTVPEHAEEEEGVGSLPEPVKTEGRGEQTHFAYRSWLL